MDPDRGQLRPCCWPLAGSRRAVMVLSHPVLCQAACTVLSPSSSTSRQPRGARPRGCPGRPTGDCTCWKFLPSPAAPSDSVDPSGAPAAGGAEMLSLLSVRARGLVGGRSRDLRPPAPGAWERRRGPPHRSPQLPAPASTLAWQQSNAQVTGSCHPGVGGTWIKFLPLHPAPEAVG